MKGRELWRVRHLEESDKLESFRCGDPDLDDFLLKDSKLYQEHLLAKTYVLERQDTIIAYFSLANDCISLRDFPTVTEFNRFRKVRFANSKRIKTYPAVKICRFAVSDEIKKLGIGSGLLDMIKVGCLSKNNAACRFLTVDAYSSAVSFYERNGFMLLQQNDGKANTSMMFYDLINAV